MIDGAIAFPRESETFAILNYAYAALESEIRIKTISDGYDPKLELCMNATARRNSFLI
jgi:hypothetical protein